MQKPYLLVVHKTTESHMKKTYYQKPASKQLIETNRHNNNIHILHKTKDSPETVTTHG